MGGTSVKGKSDRHTWWWTEKVQGHSGRQERCLFSSQNGDPQCREIYTKRKNCKRAMAIAKAEALQEWYDKLNAKDGAEEVYKIAKIEPDKKKRSKQYANLHNPSLDSIFHQSRWPFYMF